MFYINHISSYVFFKHTDQPLAKQVLCLIIPSLSFCKNGMTYRARELRIISKNVLTVHMYKKKNTAGDLGMHGAIYFSCVHPFMFIILWNVINSCVQRSMRHLLGSQNRAVQH